MDYKAAKTGAAIMLILVSFMALLSWIEATTIF